MLQSMAVDDYVAMFGDVMGPILLSKIKHKSRLVDQLLISVITQVKPKALPTGQKGRPSSVRRPSMLKVLLEQVPGPDDSNPSFSSMPSGGRHQPSW